MSSVSYEFMMLVGETTIPYELLTENEELVEMVSKYALGKPDAPTKTEILDFINENW